MSVDQFRIPVEKLKKTCDCDQELSFCNTSADVPPTDNAIGQERAAHSMQFGLDIDAPGYNIYVSGSPGTGKSTFVRSVVSQVAGKRSIPEDWCYINNFDNPENPLAVPLPAGQGRIFQRDMEELITGLEALLPKAFESDAYVQQKDAIVLSAKDKMQQLIQTMIREADEIGFRVQANPPNFIITPLWNGEPLSLEEYEKLPQEEQKKIDDRRLQVQKKIQQITHKGQLLDKQAMSEIAALDQKTASSAASSHIIQLKEKYAQNPRIADYLDTVTKDIEKRHEIFGFSNAAAAPDSNAFSWRKDDSFIPYKVNLFVNHEKSVGAPIVFEPKPNYYNLFGKIEYESQVFTVNTNFSMIKAGAIHKANGGFLILQVSDVLMEPFSWNTLKIALKYRQAIIENIGEQYRLVPTVGLKPEPVPLNLKVILIGTPYIFDLLYQMDEDFKKLFKVKVDFDTEMPRTQENIVKYVSFVSSLCDKEKLKHFDRGALGQIVEHGSLLVQDQKKLSTKLNEISEIVYEAASLADRNHADIVCACHVIDAVEERKKRLNRIEDTIREEMLTKNIRILTKGCEVGQINGLSVVEIEGHMFGVPSRITARTYAGHEGIVNIERETDMSGNIHSKGVLTLAGYLGGQFGQKTSLALTAQITFEQNYSGVEGDSASSTELYAILSSLSNVPIRQNLAVTGSVDQWGNIQPVDCVTQKIEGFFDLCDSSGLTGDQGVIIPVQNVQNLMLKDSVIKAVKEGKFHIYAVQAVAEGIELLTGIPFGEPDSDGTYPDNSLFGLVEKKLHEFVDGLMPNSQVIQKRKLRR